jgi:hypothetical protein
MGCGGEAVGGDCGLRPAGASPPWMDPGRLSNAGYGDDEGPTKDRRPIGTAQRIVLARPLRALKKDVEQLASRKVLPETLCRSAL